MSSFLDHPDDEPPARTPITAPAWWPGTPRRSAAIGLRLVALIVGTVVALLAVQWALVGHAIRTSAVAAHQAEYDAIAERVDGASVAEVREIIRVTTLNPRVVAAAVFDDTSDLAGAAVEGDRSVLENPSLVEFVVRGASTAPLDSTDGAQHAFITVLGDGKQLLVVESDITGPAATSLRSRMALVTGVALLVALPLAWLLGGRQLIRAAHHLEDQLLLDGLTGIANYRAFLRTMPEVVARAIDNDAPVSLLMVNLDRFGAYDETAGHVAADQLLVRTARMLDDLAPPEGAFRINGDQFAIVLPVGRDLALPAAERIRRHHAELTPVTVSVGVAWLDHDVHDVAELQLAATAALTHAKRSGRDRVRSYRQIEASTLLPTPRRRAALRRIIDLRTVTVAWQPIVRSDGTISGFEALSRPESDEPDLRSPAAAFELADLLGSTVELDDVCRRAILDQASQLGESSLFINISPLSLSGGGLEPDRFVSALVAAGLTPSQVVVELTEREIVDPVLLAAPVAALRAAGVRIAIDDVGAGNAGLGVLQSFAVDVIKIDRSLIVDAAAGQPRAAAVVIALRTLAHDLGVDVVAEGVERPEEIELGRRIGTMVQGYGIARPQPSVAEARAAVSMPVAD